MDDRAIVARLKAELGITEMKEDYNDQGCVIALNFSGLGITYLPSEVGLLTTLQVLDLINNQLTQVPVEVGRLSNLQILALSSNQLTQVPIELGRLTNLQELWLNGNQLTELPIELGELTNLQDLYVSNNQLTELPVELGKLTNLQGLVLDNNRLTELPIELGELTNLRALNLSNNRIRQLPVELGKLINLRMLYVSNNQLRQLPVELEKLTRLGNLRVHGNPDLLTPPPEIVAQGTQEIFIFLRELHHASVRRYEAKMLLVGEGGTGKSSLLRALRGQNFEANLDTTHGIAVENLHFPHPQLSEKMLTLNAWDFGGQDIYHATHQFFLTKRSLYVVAWNARAGAIQGKLDYWLDTIHVLAPDAPVLLVATHIDERAPDLNVQQYRSAYPQIVAVLAMSSKTDERLEALKVALAQHAAALPLVGQPWPTPRGCMWSRHCSLAAHIISALICIWIYVRKQAFRRRLRRARWAAICTIWARCSIFAMIRF